jgi:hypothetical protein
MRLRADRSFLAREVDRPYKLNTSSVKEPPMPPTPSDALLARDPARADQASSARGPTRVDFADPVPPLARAVIALYAEVMPEVRFPDLDLSVLESAADELRVTRAELARMEAELAAAQAALEAQAEELTQRAQRALAYARVFAETDATLAARVAEVGRYGTGHAAPAAKRRGRPRRSSSDPDLFGPAEPEAAQTVGVEARGPARERSEDAAGPALLD